MRNSILILVAFVSLQARADVFSDYQAVGTEALALASAPTPNNDAVVEKIKELVTKGYEIMDLFLVKYPDCTAQYAQVKSLAPTILSMTYEQIDDLFHNGTGIIEAPRVCYRGRSMVVHPYQIAALALANRLQSEQEKVDHELNEVIHRADVIKKDLGL